MALKGAQCRFSQQFCFFLPFSCSFLWEESEFNVLLSETERRSVRAEQRVYLDDLGVCRKGQTLKI